MKSSHYDEYNQGHFSILKQLGTGSYGSVDLCRDNATNKEFVLKKVQIVLQIVFYTCTLLDYHTARFILHFQRKARFTCQIVFIFLLIIHCLMPFELHILHLNMTAFNLWPIDLTGAEGFQSGRGGCVVVPGAWEHHDPLRIHQEGQRLRDPDGIRRLESILFSWYLLIF